MELKDTIDLMLSEDYKDRFKAEYYQTKIRYDKLHKMLVKKRSWGSRFHANSSNFKTDGTETIYGRVPQNA